MVGRSRVVEPKFSLNLINHTVNCSISQFQLSTLADIFKTRMSGLAFACFCHRDKTTGGGGDCDKEENANDNVSCPTAFYDKTEWRNMSQAKKLPMVDPEVTTYEEFFRDYIVKNVPCMVSSAVTSSWLARQKWVRRREEGDGEMEEIDFDYLLDIYGDESVSVVNCHDTEYKEGYGARDCRTIRFRDYVDYWKKLVNSRTETAGVETSPCLYLKDWHIVRYHQAKPELASSIPYETPTYFKSDFLNESCDQLESDDFKFCYMGPSGSFTSFHADVYGSYSWSANVFGIKKWFLYPPGKELKFYDSKARKLIYNWEDPGIEFEDYLEVIQQPGECIFVPSGWHHVVWNLTDAISINHNWFNGANLTFIWNILRRELNDVERELEDFRDIPEFKEQCQLVLKANHGMNYDDFFQLLQLIKSNRENQDSSSSFNLQSKYDLDAIHHLVQEHCSPDPTS